MMNTLLLIAFVGLAVLLAVAKLAQSRGVESWKQTGDAASPTAGASYEAIPALLTPAERSFFGVLQMAVAPDYQIFAKVRLADIVRPVRNPSRSGWQSAFNRITGKHVDFVLCDSAHLGVIGVIELDDRTHQRFESGIRDSLVDTALADAGIPVLRIAARQSYSPAQIREQVKTLFRSPDGNTSDEPSFRA